MPNQSELRKSWSSKDRMRHMEDRRHHPFVHQDPQVPHHAWSKPVLPSRHNPHSRPHGAELGPHTNKPGPIRFSKMIVRRISL
jgi:hypothetical protein